MKVSGISLVQNANTLDFPVLEGLRSILPLCDELLVNVGPSDDGTRGLIASLDDPRLRIIDGEWDRRAGAGLLAAETQRAIDQATGDWILYLQADECLPDEDLPALKAALHQAHPDPTIEGLLVDFVHFYGGPDWIGTGRAWYRREVRAVRRGIDVRSHGDAQGFRIGPGRRRIRARRSGARWFHYGWARSLTALETKRTVDNALYHPGSEGRAPLGASLPWEFGVRPFEGQQPEVMAEWLKRHQPPDGTKFRSSPWTRRRLAILLSLGIERLTGWRPFEYRNYVEV